MLKVFQDTLMKPNGRYDKQALTFFASFIISIILGVSNTIVSYVSGIVNNPTADNVFNSFMFLTAALSGANIMNKFVDMKKPPAEKEEEKYDHSGNSY